jgi:hypothetical protein
VTVADLIRSSLRVAGQLKPGRQPSVSETTDAMYIANAMLDAWNAERLAAYTISLESLQLTANKQSYTIGLDPAGVATADFNIARPERITDANLLITTDVRRRIKLLDDRGWAAIKFQKVYAPPRALYNDGNFAAGMATLYFYPIPDQNYAWEMYSWQQLAQFVNLTDTVVFPPGYADAIRYDLAVRIAPEWGLTLRPDVEELARAAKARIRRVNAPSLVMDSPDAALFGDGRRGGLYNWRDGQIET